MAENSSHPLCEWSLTPVDINLALAACPNIYDLGFFSAKPNQFFKKITNIGSLGNVVVNEKDISFQKKPETLLPVVFEKLQTS